jgi:O-succinylbenzoate synthase
MPYALDDSVLSISPYSLKQRAGLRAIILKPALLGGISVALKFARRADELALLPVISSAFESSLGLLTLANLASAVAPNVACGLDTASWFSDDLFARPLMAADGILRLAEFRMSDLPIRVDLLTEIPVPR